MDILLLFKAFVLGVVEGLTEFLPISSTGHLIVAGSLLNFNDDKGKLFEVVIQSGAIAAVIWEYRERLNFVARNALSSALAQRFIINVALAFLPLACLGLLFSKSIKSVLFAPVPVAIAFIVGGFLILIIERWQRRRPSQAVKEVDDLRWPDAVKLGFIQALALIPGTSRSGATIMGGLYLGLSRRAAAEFSFFLAIPTLILASIYELVKYRDLLSWSDLPMFAVGFLVSFASAYVCVRWLLRYISNHDFTLFAYYRIVFGLFILLSAHYGWVQWH